MGAKGSKGGEKASKLPSKHARFAEEFLVDLNATQAAIRAGYSPKTAHVQGHDLLRNPKVAALIEEGRKRRSERVELSQDTVLSELAGLIEADITDILDGGPGERLEFKQRLSTLPKHVRRAIESVSERPTKWGIAVTVKLHSKVAAIDMAMAHMGLKAPQKVDVTGQVEVAAAKQTLAEKLNALRQRSAEPGGDAGAGPEGAG